MTPPLHTPLQTNNCSRNSTWSTKRFQKIKYQNVISYQLSYLKNNIWYHHHTIRINIIRSLFSSDGFCSLERFLFSSNGFSCCPPWLLFSVPVSVLRPPSFCSPSNIIASNKSVSNKSAITSLSYLAKQNNKNKKQHYKNKQQIDDRQCHHSNPSWSIPEYYPPPYTNSYLRD